MTAEYETTHATIPPDYEPIKVEVTNLPGAIRRKRRALRTGTVTLTAAFGAGGGGGPTQLLMPQADTRVEAYITSATEASPPVLYIAPSQAGANGQAGGAAQIVGSDTTPVPVNTTDQVWVSAASGFPVTVSYWAIYEVDE